MRIFIVCSRLCYGGAERVAVMWANGFARRGYEVYLISNLFEDRTYKVDDEVYTLNMVSNNSNKFIKWSGMIPHLRKYIKCYKPDVIIGVEWACSLMGRVATIGYKVPVIATEHNAFERPASSPMDLCDRFTKFWLNYLYKYITVLTEADKHFIGKKFKNVYVMPNPLGIEPVAELPKKENIIIAVGRTDVWYCKGFDILIKAWGRIANEYPEWKLQIAGNCVFESSVNYLKQIAEESNVLNRIEFLGFNKDIAELYKRSAVFVLSSRYEGFGLVLIEAMSQGCACVACDFKGRQSEIIANDTEGLTCETENEEALSKALSKLLSDETLRKTIQQNAIERSKYYKIESIIDKWEQLFKEILSQ